MHILNTFREEAMIILEWLAAVVAFLTSPTGLAVLGTVAVVLVAVLVLETRRESPAADPVTVEDLMTEVLRLAAVAGMRAEDEDEEPISSLTFAMLAEQLSEVASCSSIHIWDDEGIRLAAEQVDRELGAA